RAMLQKMGENMKASFVIETRAGANGIIGMDIGAKSAPDGYTLISGTTGTVTISPSVQPKMPFDVTRDIAPITNMGEAPFLLVAHPSLNARNVRELIALAKKRPGELNYGSPGVGGTNHLGALLFSQSSGIQMTHVVFKGSQPMLVDIMGGHVMMGFDSLQATLPHIRSGRLRALGIGAEKRTPLAPDIPTITESGGPPQFLLGSWYGFFAPAGVAADIMAKLNTEAVKALSNPELRERYLTIGVTPIGDTPEQFATTIRNDLARWAKVVRVAHLRIE
ncbi:MAG TPA: tripartite tricarboxylate transporter substrate binding protein, partial [Burkholderiales bacterium]|nr:tripartite tricarboxylate transporter substrate binding protein [Burkholderiales bacterium]